VAFLGLASDEGVRRNNGRVGAADGTKALRTAMSNLAVGRQGALYDAGDIACVGTELEAAQNRYSEQAAQLLQGGNVVIGLGGGHEIAWASFCGLIEAAAVKPKGRLGILNLDAHFDLRKADVPTSGTSFRQALERAQSLDYNVEYRVIGISEPSNTAALFDVAQKLGVTWRSDDHMALSDLSLRLGELESWFASLDCLYLTICLDVLPASVAPGVSAPAARGVALEVIEPIVAAAAKSGKLRIADVAELCPRLDIDDRTARTAARLIWRIVREFGG
jgi:formiminoglutamase